MAMTDHAIHAATPTNREERIGILLVFLSALIWSFGGAIARFVETPDSWTIVFWRSIWATAFLFCFMLWRDGLEGTITLFRRMGLPGILVGACFASASCSFVVALAHTTVANILLIYAGVPLIAALIGRLAFGEVVSGATWGAIAAVILGVAVMVSDTLSGTTSLTGTAIALLGAFSFGVATVITRQFSHVRMTPATCLGTVFAALVALPQASSLAVSETDFALLLAFGAFNLGFGLALFTYGARLVPAALAALIGTIETVLGPVWAWLIHDEVPTGLTLIGGSVVFLALLVHIGMQSRRPGKAVKPGVTGVQTPV
jgi:drug/metabolite transporter (DMT)-like permease